MGKRGIRSRFGCSVACGSDVHKHKSLWIFSRSIPVQQNSEHSERFPSNVKFYIELKAVLCALVYIKLRNDTYLTLGPRGDITIPLLITFEACLEPR